MENLGRDETTGLRNERPHLKFLEETCMMCSGIYGKLVWGPWSLKADEFNLDGKGNRSVFLMKVVFQEDETVSKGSE